MNDGGLPDDVTDYDIDQAYGGDCPDDRGLENEQCQECQRLNDCAREWAKED